MAYAPGTVFAGFTIERTLGAGGMGTVYLARHPRLPRRDALKLLRADLSADPGFRTRFEREADLAARLDHRNIVTVYDRGRSDEQLWIDMQYVDGIDASQALQDEPASMTVERVLRIVSEVGTGLDFAHRHGLWHRDVKPANILLAATSNDPVDYEPERVLLTDFGVAKAVDEARQLTSTGNMLATLAYAAPEQIESRALDHRVDIYALGCVLYELLTGSVPFPEDSAYLTMAAHLNKPPPRPSVMRPDLPEAIDDVVARGMAKSRDDRFASCRELAQAARLALAPQARAPMAAPAREPDRPAPAPSPESPPYAEPPTTRATEAPVLPPSPSGPVGQRPSGPVGQRPSGPVGQRPSGPVGPRPPYQIRVRRTGARGEEDLGPVYTDTLSLLETSVLEELLGRAEFFALPPTLPPDRARTGDVRQEITVISAGRSHTVGYDLAGSRRPAELDEFVARLERMAQWRGQPPPARVSAPHAVPQFAAPVPAPMPQPLLGGPPPPRPPSKPWYARPAALAGLAAVLVLVVVLAIVLAGGGGGELAAPDAVEAQASARAVELSWDEVSGATQYEIRRDGDLLDRTPETSFVDEDVEGGQRYRYTVVALGEGEAESPAAARSVTVPEARPAPPVPEGLVVSRVDGAIEVGWDPVDGASTYNLFRGTVRVYGGSDTTFVDQAAPMGTNQYTVLAAASDGTLSERSRPVPITLSEDWGDLAEIVAAFSNLLPLDPSENGYEDSTCGVGGAELDSLAVGIAVCDYPNGIHAEIRRYADQATLQQRVDQVATTTAAPTEWFYEGDDGVRTSGGMVYESLSTDEVASRFATFVREDRVLMTLYVEWPGHSEPELFSQWWLPAPF